MTGPRILLTGAAGQLGHELAQALRTVGEVTACDRATLDLAKPDSIVAVVRALKPAIIVNAGAYTAVDRAESEVEAAFAVNAKAPEVLASEARRLGALLVHYSTDYVFDGSATSPYGEDAEPAPLNVYGASKLEGERAIAAMGLRALILRTSWVYGLQGRNFLLTIRRLAAERDSLSIVADQTGTPNWTRELAKTTAAALARGADYAAERSGLYHLTAGGATTWYGFACAIVGTGADSSVSPRNLPRVLPITTREYPTPARRPAYAVLDGSKFGATFGLQLPDWRESLASCLASEVAAVD